MPNFEKLSLWRESTKGIKSRFKEEAKPSVIDRDDIPDLQVEMKADRGNRLQEIRLRRYPSINVSRDNLFAGKVEESLSDATDKLNSIGFRTNPTAYVEVTEENGPDDGSYSRTIVTETGVGLDFPRLTNQPKIFRRVKEQIHVVVYQVEDGTEFLVHRERSAWLQPARHVLVNESSARRGVRDFRDIWYDEFGEELPGKEDVKWDTTH